MPLGSERGAGLGARPIVAHRPDPALVERQELPEVAPFAVVLRPRERHGDALAGLVDRVDPERRIARRRYQPSTDVRTATGLVRPVSDGTGRQKRHPWPTPRQWLGVHQRDQWLDVGRRRVPRTRADRVDAHRPRRYHRRGRGALAGLPSLDAFQSVVVVTVVVVVAVVAVVAMVVVDGLEVVPVAPLRDLAADLLALLVGVPEVDPRPDPGVDDLVDRVREAREAPRSPPLFVSVQPILSVPKKSCSVATIEPLSPVWPDGCSG